MVVVDAWSACIITEWSSRLGCSFYSVYIYVCVSGEVSGLLGEGMVQTMARGGSCLSQSKRSQPSYIISCQFSC